MSAQTEVHHSTLNIFSNLNIILLLRCTGKVFAAEKMVAASGFYHRHCFRCVFCSQPLDSTRYRPIRSQYYTSHDCIDQSEALPVDRMGVEELHVLVSVSRRRQLVSKLHDSPQHRSFPHIKAGLGSKLKTHFVRLQLHGPGEGKINEYLQDLVQ